MLVYSKLHCFVVRLIPCRCHLSTQSFEYYRLFFYLTQLSALPSAGLQKIQRQWILACRSLCCRCDISGILHFLNDILVSLFLFSKRYNRSDFCHLFALTVTLPCFLFLKLFPSKLYIHYFKTWVVYIHYNGVTVYIVGVHQLASDHLSIRFEYLGDTMVRVRVSWWISSSS